MEINQENINLIKYADDVKSTLANVVRYMTEDKSDISTIVITSTEINCSLVNGVIFRVNLENWRKDLIKCGP